MVAIDLNKYLHKTLIDKVEAAEVDALTQGVNYTYQGKTWHVRMLETNTEDAENSQLIFRAYSNTESGVMSYVGKDSEYLYDSDRNEQILPFRIINKGTKDDAAETPVFARKLNAEETVFYHENGLTMPSFDLRKYSMAYTPPALKNIGHHAFMQGVNFKFEGEIYNVRMLESIADDGQSTLIFHMHSNDKSYVRYYKDDGTFQELYDSNRNQKLLFLGILNSQKLMDAETPVFTGKLNAEETAFYQEHGLTMPTEEVEAPAKTSWSSKRKGTAVIATMLGLAVLGYGAKKLKQHGLSMPARPSMPDLSAYNPMNLWRKETSV